MSIVLTLPFERYLEGIAEVPPSWPAASLEALAGVRQPVLQLLGGDSAAPFQEATEALDARLRDGRVVVIDGARHAAHHTHVDAFAAAVESFLAATDVAD